MKYSEAKQGRVFVMRLEDGDIVHDEIERFFRTMKEIPCSICTWHAAGSHLP
jgi:predicted DNA-binding protein with PD1-like motif